MVAPDKDRKPNDAARTDGLTAGRRTPANPAGLQKLACTATRIYEAQKRMTHTLQLANTAGSMAGASIERNGIYDDTR